MHKLITACFVAVAILATLSFAQPPLNDPAPVLKIGKVNSEAIYQGYPAFRAAEEQLAKEAKGWQTERASWEADMERLQNVIIDRENQFQAGQAMYTDAKKRQVQGELDSLKADLYNRTQQRSSYEQDRLTRRRQELLSAVLDDVSKVITKIGEDNDYDLILDATNGTIVYAKNPDELTDQVLNALKVKK